MPKWSPHRRVGKEKIKLRTEPFSCLFYWKQDSSRTQGRKHGEFCPGSPLCHHAKGGGERLKGNCWGICGQNRVRTFSTWPPSGNQLHRSRSQLTARMIFKASTVSLHAYWGILTSRSPRKVESHYPPCFAKKDGLEKVWVVFCGFWQRVPQSFLRLQGSILSSHS